MGVSARSVVLILRGIAPSVDAADEAASTIVLAVRAWVVVVVQRGVVRIDDLSQAVGGIVDVFCGAPRPVGFTDFVIGCVVACCLGSAVLASTKVHADLSENHGRKVARSYLQNLSEAVGNIALAKQDNWHYTTPKLNEPVKTVSIGVDGTCMLLCKDGYRQAMVGTISLYDTQGERQHTIYIGATPEYGKATFWLRMKQEIAQVKKTYPEALYVGIADGAKDNWSFLKQHTEKQTLDFYHATADLNGVASAAFPRNKEKGQVWLDSKCHELKHIEGAADNILDEIKAFKNKKLSKATKQNLDSSITYFENHKSEMNYAESIEANLPIGSGVTEAACKTVIKQRLCQSGMKWIEKGAGIVLSLRTLVLTPGRWQQFWDKINQYALPVLA